MVLIAAIFNCYYSGIAKNAFWQQFKRIRPIELIINNLIAAFIYILSHTNRQQDLQYL
jgi:hypothetical protein